jgi:peptidoglycan/LPS O-acetylase OafA/YrhL
MNYRREIDGLRAVAVLPVILFHAGFQTFRGGFVGVDVFFVISGYLITSLLLAEKQAGTFSLIHFYERRARRILPALFVVMLSCLPFAWLWLWPSDMKSFLESMIAVSVLASNVFFWQTSGYFAAAAQLQPLLHTWSLAVEEQYYLLFPLLVMLTWRFGKCWMGGILVVLLLMSLTLAQISVQANPLPTFYLLPTRGWELLIGAVVGLYGSASMKPFHPAASEVGSWIGLILFLSATFIFDQQTPFPSLYTLVPTLGTACIILFATPQTGVGKLLGHPLLVGMGLVSYSAYLWHQPLFAFARHASIEEPSAGVFGVLVLITWMLAYCSWKYVELPFRNKQYFKQKQIFAYATLGSACCVAISLACQLTENFGGRATQAQRDFLNDFDHSIPEWKYFMRIGIPQNYRLQCDFYDILKYRSGYPTQVARAKISEECFVRKSTLKHAVFIWGDSHAQQFYGGLKKAMPEDWQILQIASSGCAAQLNAKPNQQDYCEFSNWFAYKTIVEIKPDVVLFGQERNHSISNMMAIDSELKRIGVQKVLFTGPTPRWRADLPTILVSKLWDNTPRRTWLGIDMQVMQFDKQLKADFPQSSATQFISVIDYFCNNSGCLVYFGEDRKEGITSWDDGHLTPIASYHFAREVLAKAVVRE